MKQGSDVADDDTVMRTVDLVKRFALRGGPLPWRKRQLEAVSGVTLTLPRATTLGLVGESGSGKSTVARLVTRLIEPTSGRVEIAGQDVSRLGGARLRAMRRNVQMVFQDPYSSFDPLSTIGNSVAEPLRTHRGDDRSGHAAKVAELLGLVGLTPSLARRLPAELSGGQLQRAAIARALAVQPNLLVLDEPVTALDVSTQAQVINLISEIQDRLGVACLFIAHDLSVVRHVSDSIAVMQLGRVVEQGPSEAIHTSPNHPYTAGLLSVVPIPDPVRQRRRKRVVVSGESPSPISPPSGCRFRTRCAFAMDVCHETPPAFVNEQGVVSHCHLHTEGPKLAGESIFALLG